MSIIPVILCGGSGTRMWPLSRGEYPKQFINFYGEQSLLQQAVTRLAGIPDASAPILVSHHEQRFLLAEQLHQVGIQNPSIILEPMGRNTAPAVAASAFFALEQDEDAILVVLPSDHIIRHNTVFQALVNDAVALAQQSYLVTFGVLPDCPHTGYGYIRKGEPLASGGEAYRVSTFVEKPDSDTAMRFLQGGQHCWNSGMFVFKARVYLDELATLQPKMFKQVQQSVLDAKRDLDFIRLDEAAFEQCPANSIDYAVMEQTQHAALLVAHDLGWSDVGSWDALAAVSPADEQGNNILGDVLAIQVNNSYLRSEHRLVAAIGVDNVVVIETADAVLVAHKDNVQEIKRVVETLNQSGRLEGIKHRRVYRPWGSYDSIDSGTRFQVKRIIVNPGSSLSLQMHFHRAEHWIVVRGTARITHGTQVQLLTENQSTYIPVGTVHRLENPGKLPLELIEIQSGGYLGEDDIIRFDDVYGRVDVPICEE